MLQIELLQVLYSVNLLCSYGGNVIVTTNGTTDYYVKNDFIKDNLFFQLSIDGDRNKHNEIRGKGTFEKTFKTAKKLNDICAKFSIASTVSRKNFENMPLLAKELEKLENLRYWRLSYEMPFGSANFKDMLSSNEWNNFVDKILDIAKLRVRIKKIFPFELYDKKKEDIDKLILNNRHCFNCGSGKDKVYIYPDFNVYPCTCLTDFCIGNLKEKTLDQILSCEAITLFTEYKTCNNSICNNCGITCSTERLFLPGSKLQKENCLRQGGCLTVTLQPPYPTVKQAMRFPNSIIPRCLGTVCCLSGIYRLFSEVVSDQTSHFGNCVLRGVGSGMGFYNISCIPDFIFTHH